MDYTTMENIDRLWGMGYSVVSIAIELNLTNEMVMAYLEI